MITSSECRPLLSVTDKKEQEETRLHHTLWLHHTLDWVPAFSGVWTSAGLWLQKRTWHYCGGLWLLSSIIIKFESLKYLLVPNCFRLDEFVLFCTLCIANNQAISDENSSCLIIHLFLNTEDDSRALILLGLPTYFFSLKQFIPFVYIPLIQSAILEYNCCIFHYWQKQQWFFNDCNDPPSSPLIVMILVVIVSQAQRKGNQLIGRAFSVVSCQSSWRHREPTVFWAFFEGENPLASMTWSAQ